MRTIRNDVPRSPMLLFLLADSLNLGKKALPTLNVGPVFRAMIRFFLAWPFDVGSFDRERELFFIRK